MKSKRNAPFSLYRGTILVLPMAWMLMIGIACSGEQSPPAAPETPSEPPVAAPEESAEPEADTTAPEEQPPAEPTQGTVENPGAERPFGSKPPTEEPQPDTGETPSAGNTPQEDIKPESICDESKQQGCFVQISAATFLRGAQKEDPAGAAYDPRARTDEGPVKGIALPAFWMMRTEVTAQEYGTCIRMGACRPEDVDSSQGLFTHKNQGKSNHPINGVNWFAARDYCAFVGGRLPSEAEWEYAARGTTSSWFPWGNEPGCGVSKTNAVGSDKDVKVQQQVECDSTELRSVADARGESPFGLIGMAGGVWEWTADWYATNAYQSDTTENPQGPEKGDERVQRGGGWSNESAWELRSAGRAGLSPEQRLDDVGFRCAWPATVQGKAVIVIPPGFADDGEGDTPILRIRPGKLVFDEGPTGKEQTKVIRISNLGSGRVEIARFELTGATFSLKEPLSVPFNIEPNGWAEVIVVYQPEDPTKDKGSIRILSNAPPKPLRTVTLKTSAFKE
jgi:sulfatase modifying factor 1